MKLHYYGWLAGVMLLSACGSKESSGSLEPGTVDVVGAIEKPEELKASMLGSKIRFVPLETTDSALLTDSWRAAFVDDKIVIGNAAAISFGGDRGNSAMVFDLNTGKYIRSIGSQGEGPGEYSHPVPHINREGTLLYFSPGNRMGWETYDIEGRYKGKIMPDVPFDSLTFVAARDSVVLLQLSNREAPSRKKVYREYSLSGNLLDSIVMFPDQGAASKRLVFSGNTSIYTHDTPLRSTIIEFKNEDKSIVWAGDRTWYVGDELHLKEDYCDTIYRLDKSSGDKVSLIFNTGEHRFPVENLNKENIKEDNIFITDVLETPSKVVFALSHGWIGDDGHKEYIGIYDRETKKTYISSVENKITDDLSGFMPFIPNMVTPKGEIVGYLTMEEIEEWLEDNPEVERPSWLKGMKSDDNPVLVIISD